MRKFFGQNTKKIVAASLIFWMSGILFLFCCETTKVEAQAESCPLAKAHHCSKQISSGGVSPFASVQLEQQAFDCCRFLPQIFDKARRIEKIQKVELATASATILLPKFSVATRQFPARKTFRPVIINRENTHLKNCVFRI